MAPVARDERPTPLADGVWIDHAPARILGMQLTSTMTVLRLGDGSLLLHSRDSFPVDARRAAPRRDLGARRVHDACAIREEIRGTAGRSPGEIVELLRGLSRKVRGSSAQRP